MPDYSIIASMSGDALSGSVIRGGKFFCGGRRANNLGWQER
jgi:hypothetical protein